MISYRRIFSVNGFKVVILLSQEDSSGYLHVGLILIGLGLSSERSIPHSKSVLSTVSVNSISANHCYKTFLMVIAILHEREIFTKFFKWIHLINHDIYSFSCLLVNNHAFAWIFVIYMCVGYITVPGNLVSPTTPWETNSVGRWTYRANWTTRSVTPSTLSSASNTLVSSYLDDCLEYSSMLYIYKNFFFES